MTSTDPADADITAAFEELRREVSLTRAALEGLTAARERMPDYTATLGEIIERQKAAAMLVERIAKAPAVSLTPDAMAVRIVEAATPARAADAKLIYEARDALSRSVGAVDSIVKRGQAADQEVKKQLWAAAGGLFAGILIWSALPGVVARSLPTSWHVPQWMAERTMGRRSIR